MSISSILYYIFLMPLEILFETVFIITGSITDNNAGQCIIVLSIFVNILVLPLYNMAEKGEIDMEILNLFEQSKAWIEDRE